MEHADLVAEMAHVEHLSTQDRLHLARRRRLQQLKVWTQREKKWSGQKVSKSNKHIYFSDSVMLLEAAARNDIDEGKLNHVSGYVTSFKHTGRSRYWLRPCFALLCSLNFCEKSISGPGASAKGSSALFLHSGYGS